jgi:hypothetical protein
MRTHLILLAGSFLMLVAAGCGDGTTGANDDAGGRDAASSPDASLDGSDCRSCALPPAGCSYMDGCHCSGLVCADGAVDAGPESDTGAPGRDAGSSDVDAASSDVDSGGVTTDAGCVAPVCPTLPAGCTYEGATACTCGTVQCAPPAGCSPRCGGRQYCAYADGTCGATGAGMCVTRPDACIDLFAPVCGCDGMTYSNSCDAAAAGQNVAFDGECPTSGGDCTVTGCAPGETCMPCRGGANVCLPVGTAC